MVRGWQMKRVCVVTPFHAEPPEVLARCIQSVAAQTVPCDHLMVGDGARLPPELAQGVRLLALDRTHADYGNTPRGVGALLAAAEGYDLIAFLDADNWYDPDHVETCLAAATDPATDVVLAHRRLIAEDGTALADHGPPLAEHCDTNCFAFLPGAFSILPVWALIPTYLSDQGDRIFYHQLKTFGLELRQTDHPTVNYVTRARGLDFARGQRVLRDSDPRTRQLARRGMAGFGIDPPLVGFDAAAAAATGVPTAPPQERRDPGAALAAVAARQGAGGAGVSALRLGPLLADPAIRKLAFDQFTRLGGEARWRMTSRARLPQALPLHSDGSPQADAVLALTLAMVLRVLGAIETADPAIAALARRMGVDVSGPTETGAPRAAPVRAAVVAPPQTSPSPSAALTRLPDRRRLILCAPPRSGSETLCDLLRAAGMGDPREYLNPWAAPHGPDTERLGPDHIARHLADRMAETPADGLFAIKLQGWQINRYLKNATGAALFDGATVIYLLRNNMQAQIASQAAAKLTGAWFRDRHDREFAAGQIASAHGEATDFILREYGFFTQFFATTGIIPQVVASEDLFADPVSVLRAIAKRIGHHLPDDFTLAHPATNAYPAQQSLRDDLARYAQRHRFGGFFNP